MWGASSLPLSLHRDNTAVELTCDTCSYPVVISGELGGRGSSSFHTPERKSPENLWGQYGDIYKKGRLTFYLWLDFCVVVRKPLLQMKGTQGRDSTEGQPAGGTDNPLKSPSHKSRKQILLWLTRLNQGQQKVRRLRALLSCWGPLSCKATKECLEQDRGKLLPFFCCEISELGKCL